MGLKWDMGGEGVSLEGSFNGERANKWTDATVSLSGNTIHLSGTAQKIAGPLQYNTLYKIISKVDFHAVASSSPTLTASTAYEFFPANVISFHIPKSGSSEYVSIVNSDGSVVEAWISIVEKT